MVADAVDSNIWVVNTSIRMKRSIMACLAGAWPASKGRPEAMTCKCFYDRLGQTVAPHSSASLIADQIDVDMSTVAIVAIAPSLFPCH